MPKPIYLHPFMDQKHYFGFGGHALGDWTSTVSLHAVSNHTESARYKYLWKMGANSLLFQGYVGAADRIYVLGHCGPASHTLSTGTAAGGAASLCTAAQLAQILIAHGLPVASQANIRIHACNSATPPVGGAGAGTSFAEWFKMLMQGQGYNNVTVRGYNTAVGVYLIHRWGNTGNANNHAHDY